MNTTVIDGVTYTSRDGLKNVIRSRLPTDPTDTPKRMDIDRFWTDLINGHKEMRDKFAVFGEEPVDMAYRLNPRNRKHTELGFVGDRGGFMPFSWNRAAEWHLPPKDPEALHRADLISGMRDAIQPQITTFRSTVTINGEVRCAATGEWFPANQIDIDHHPRAFADIAKEFLEIAREDNGGALPEIEKQNSGHPRHNRMKSLVHEEAWIEWHRINAKYQPLSKAAHRAKKKTK